MIEWLQTALAYGFMRNALLAAVLVSLICGAIGTLVVLNRIVMISGGIAHAAYGGVGLAYFFGFDPVLGAIGFGFISSIGMGITQRKLHERADTVIGVLWAIGMAIGIIFVSLSPGYKADLMSYLFGSILAVSVLDLRLMLAVAVVAILFIMLFYRPLQAISFDETFAAVRNLPVTGLYLAMIVVVGLAVVISMRVVGLILVIAFLTIPPAIANMFCRRIWEIMLVAMGLGLLFSISGLLVSYSLNLPAGAVIILIMGLAYLLASLLKSVNSRSNRVSVAS
jgi:zinc transport system permease protein